MHCKTVLLCTLGISLLWTTGCTSIEVTPLPMGENLGIIKIQKNPKVKVADFVDVMRENLSSRGIQSTVVEDSYVPKSDEFTITYVAYRGWDFVLFMKDANVEIHKNNQIVASGNFHLILGGGFSFYKWYGTRYKMEPVYAEMLKNYPVKVKQTKK